MDIYRGEDAKIGYVLAKLGMDEEAEEMFVAFNRYADYDESVYKHLSLSAYYSHRGDQKKAIDHLKLFAQSDNYHYWIILFVPIDPLFDNIKDLPDYRKVWSEIETKFWENHDQIKATLRAKELL
jgi:tetratricopeptide (TPR) repeat protein